MDGGVTWEQANANSLNSQPIQLAVHPTEASIVAFATQGGLFLSQDFGDTFSLINSENAVTTAHFDPNGERLIYGYQWLYEYNLDTEETIPFQNVPEVQSDQAILYTDINPTRDEIAISTSNRDILLSHDDGQSWIQIGEDGVSR